MHPIQCSPSEFFRSNSNAGISQVYTGTRRIKISLEQDRPSSAARRHFYSSASGSISSEGASGLQQSSLEQCLTCTIRYKIRGVRNVVFYGLPDHPQFYTEFLSFPFLDDGVDASDVTCKALYCRYDWMKLERIAGTESALELLKSASWSW